MVGNPPYIPGYASHGGLYLLYTRVCLPWWLYLPVCIYPGMPPIVGYTSLIHPGMPPMVGYTSLYTMVGMPPYTVVYTLGGVYPEVIPRVVYTQRLSLGWGIYRVYT